LRIFIYFLAVELASLYCLFLYIILTHTHKGLSAKWFWLRELLVQANIDYLLCQEEEKKMRGGRDLDQKERKVYCTQRNEEFRETDLPY
jgi:hypothetical protein